MHVDTIQPTWKVWLFADVKLEDGPLNYVNHSHQNGPAKMRWLHGRTHHLVGEETMPRTAPIEAPPGPHSDASHGWEGSLRVLGFDPLDARTARTTLDAIGFASPTPITTPVGSNKATLVIADTSGFHFRGAATSTRGRLQTMIKALPCYSSKSNGEVSLPGGSKGALPRRNAFHCIQRADACQNKCD